MDSAEGKCQSAFTLHPCTVRTCHQTCHRLANAFALSQVVPEDRLPLVHLLAVQSFHFGHITSFFCAHVCRSANTLTHMRWLTCRQNNVIACSFLAWKRSAGFERPHGSTQQQHNAPGPATWQRFTASVHQLTQWVGELQQRLAAQQPQQQPHQQQQKFCMGKEVKIEKFGGNGYHNCSGDIRAVLGTRQNREKIDKNRRRRDNAIDAPAIPNAHVMGAADNEAFHAYIVVHTAGGPRSIVEGCWCHGLEACRKLKNRFDPETEMNPICATLRALRPTKDTDVNDLIPALER